MTARRVFGLFALSLTVLMLVANFQTAPGYMDADYHLYMAEQISNGQGFTEGLLWNYLDAPQSLPHPSHAYWPPVPSLLAALGLWFFPMLESFSAGRIPTILLAAAISPLTAFLAFQYTKRKGTAMLAGLLAIAAIFYLPFLTTTDSFSPSMVLGLVFFLLVARLEDRNQSRFIIFALGLTSGLLHLTRAEGALWLMMAFLAYFLLQRNGEEQKSAWILILGGYLLIMLPWFMRNQIQFASAIAPGALKTLWLSNYDELFTYPAAQLNFAHWLESGGQAILKARLWATGQNAVTGLVVQGEIFLAPLAIIGAWDLRRRQAVLVAAIAWGILFLVMSLLFPFPGVRGGFFHAGAVLQPLIWVLAANGLDRFVDWGAVRRNWNQQQAAKVFRSAAVIFALVMSVFIFRQRVIGSENADWDWDDYFAHYQELNAKLENLHGASEYMVMVNNPPGYALAAKRPAIVIPDGELSASIDAAQEYGATYLLLEDDHPQGLNDLYGAPEAEEAVEFLATIEGTHIFRFLAPNNDSR